MNIAIKVFNLTKNLITVITFDLYSKNSHYLSAGAKLPLQPLLPSFVAAALPLRRGGVIIASGLNGKLSRRVVSGVIRNSN